MEGLDKIKPNDPRVKKNFAEVNGRKWYYLDVAAKGQQKGVVVLVHGFPDLSLAWRYQIPVLIDLGFRCIAIDCMGYGDTGTSTDLQDFTFKSHAAAIACISASIGAGSIILGGHDWGGLVVYRTAQYYPDLVSHVFSVATAYQAIRDAYIPVEMLVKGPLPQFGYQLQVGSAEHKVEKVVKDEARIRKMLNGLYGGQSSSGRPCMTPEDGINLDVMREDEIGKTPLLDDEEVDYYVAEYAKNGMTGPCNWYRTHKLNYDNDSKLPEEQRKGVSQPTLFIQALKDNILKPELAKGMKDHVPHLTYKEVDSSHWALWQTAKDTNNFIHDWFQSTVLSGNSKI